MNVRRQLTYLTVISSVCIVTVAFLFSAFTVPSSITTQAILQPGREWIVQRQTGGRLVVAQYNHELGTTETYLVHQFEREDAVRVDFREFNNLDTLIHAGDTLALVHSANFSFEQTALSGELAQARASLLVAETGEKQSMIREAEEGLSRARSEYDALEKARVRMRSLFEKGIASSAELEHAESLADAAKAAVSEAEAKVRTRSSGAKSEEIERNKSVIASLTENSNALRSKAGYFTLCAPFNGRVYRGAASDTLMRLGEDNSFVGITAIPWTERESIPEHASVDIEVPGLGETVSGTLVVKQNSVQLLGSRQIFVAVIRVDHPPSRLLPGLSATCRIRCRETRVHEYIWHLLKRWISV